MTTAIQVKPKAEVVPADNDFTPEQMSLITRTIAPGATPDELKLFLYRCKSMGLDPLKPGLIHFVKYGSSPGTIVVGIDGFRVRASRSGKLSGIKRGVLRDAAGKCVGGWAEVFRSDWAHSARAEVSLAEYDTGRAQWAKMKETMIQKVAEAAALRMAFPDDVGGLYAQEEMDQAGTPPRIYSDQPGANDGYPDAMVAWTFPVGQFHKRKLTEIDVPKLRDWTLKNEEKLAKAKKAGVTLDKHDLWVEAVDMAAEYLEGLERPKPGDFGAEETEPGSGG